MICVGITGSYASGKTFVLNYLASQGYNTFSSDEYIRELYNDPKVQKKVINLLTALKTFDKRKIADIIYEKDEEREKLQYFIHPLVINKLLLFKRQNAKADIIFVEIPLLFEAKFEKYFDFCITTHCSEQTRLSRAMQREGFSVVNYNKIAEIQLPQKAKIAKSDFVINTDIDHKKLKKQILQLIENLKCTNYEK